MSNPICNYKIEPLEAINLLEPREKKVIQMRLGIGEYTKCYSLKEIGQTMGSRKNPEKFINQERVRQIEAKALRKIRHPSSGCKVIYDE